MADLISIGKILNFFGIQGEAKVGFSNENQIKAIKKVVVIKNGEKIPLTVKNVRFHKNFAIIKFDEINSINEVEKIKGEKIFIDRENVEKNLKKDEFLINDLIACKVYNQKNELKGEISSVANAFGNDILYVNTGKIGAKEVLIPFVEAIVPIVDIKNKKIIINEIEGLFDEI